MLQTLRDQQFPRIMLKLFIFFSLFFPYYSYQGVYMPCFILVHVFSALYILSMLLQGRIHFGRQSWFGYILLALLLVFDLLVAIFRIDSNWYFGPLNASICFAQFIVLICTKDSDTDEIIPFLLQTIVVSTLIGFIPYLMGHGFVWLAGNDFYFGLMDAYELRYAWIFRNKCNYGLMLLAYLGLMITCRTYFQKKKLFWGSIAVVVCGIFISNSRTAILSMLLIALGFLLDYILHLPAKKRLYGLLTMLLLAIAGVILLFIVAQRRSISTLGGRTYIWELGIQFLREHPMGLGNDAGFIGYDVPDWPGHVNNCHNVFLNLMLMYSIPAGAIYGIMLITIAIVSVFKRPSFLSASIWGAILIQMMIDWSLTPEHTAFFLTIVYFTFFAPIRKK